MTWACLTGARAKVKITFISQGQASAKAKAQGLVSLRWNKSLMPEMLRPSGPQAGPARNHM